MSLEACCQSVIPHPGDIGHSLARPALQERELTGSRAPGLRRTEQSLQSPWVGGQGPSNGLGWEGEGVNQRRLPEEVMPEICSYKDEERTKEMGGKHWAEGKAPVRTQKK